MANKLGEIFIYDSLEQKKRRFEPIKPGIVSMYVCGPTVYGLLHIGNFRGPVFFNSFRNWLERSGFKVLFVFNFTDIDDKIIQKAKEENCLPQELARQYIDEFYKDYKSLGLLPHTYNPLVSETLDEIRNMISSLIERGHAYEIDGEVFYSVSTFRSYGKLSKRVTDELISGKRVAVDQKKRNPADFTLWKPSKSGEPAWPSPWGHGRPGWHIECSAMILKHLGQSIDIHGGGADLMFPHHENEIAQSEGACGSSSFVNYWMHHALVSLGDKKMSKSLGNIITARDFLRSHPAELLKFLYLSVHYRHECNFSELAVKRSLVTLSRIYSSLARAERVASGVDKQEKYRSSFAQNLFQKADDEITSSLNDDFNTPEAFSVIHRVISEVNRLIPLGGVKPSSDGLALASAFPEWLRSWGEVFGLFQEDSHLFLKGLDEMILKQQGIAFSEVESLVRQRQEARLLKDFQKADLLRDRLKELGVMVQDIAGETVWEVDKTRIGSDVKE